jgi:hypothetical protein
MAILVLYYVDERPSLFLQVPCAVRGQLALPRDLHVANMSDTL